MERVLNQSSASRSYRTVKLTAAPTVTFSPAAGFCETITLAGDGGAVPGAGEDVSVVNDTAPRRSPASCTVCVPLPRVWPMKLGITKACGSCGLATSRLMLGAETPLALGGGACDRTWPSG